MQDSTKRAKAKIASGQSGSGGSMGVQDAGSQKLAKLAGKVGNNSIADRLSVGNHSRDDLLDFLTQRLLTIQEVQQREVTACGYKPMRENWKQIADSQRPDVTAPDPTKWREAASLYERAAFKLCNGELGVGNQLIRQAADAEERAMDQVSSTINISDLEGGRGVPEVASQVDENQGCSPCDVPDAVAIADKIQAVTTSVKDVPDNPRSPIPWWTDLEEEEEEGGGGGDEGGG